MISRHLPHAQCPSYTRIRAPSLWIGEQRSVFSLLSLALQLGKMALIAGLDLRSLLILCLSYTTHLPWPSPSQG